VRQDNWKTRKSHPGSAKEFQWKAARQLLSNAATCEYKTALHKAAQREEKRAVHFRASSGQRARSNPQEMN